MPAPQARRRAAVHHDAWHFREARLNALHVIIGDSAGRIECGERNGINFCERPDARAAQRGHMAVAAEFAAEIARDGAHIGAFAAARFEHSLVRREAHKIQRPDVNGARGKLNRFAIAGQIIGALAVNLDRGIDGRRLHDFADEGGQRIEDRLRLRARLAGARYGAIRIVAVGFDAPAHGEAIGLLAILHERHGLRRLAERHWQNTRRKGIKRACMAGFFGVEDALEPCDGMRRGHADRLVENNPAVDVDARGAALVHFIKP